VDVKIQGSNVKIKGPKGELMRTFPADVEIALDDGKIVVRRPSDEPRLA
jgi:large subunit ribosomal protein L6